MAYPYQEHQWVTREIIRREYLQNIEDGIYDEQQERLRSEGVITQSVTDEENRAKTKENELNLAIGAEETRATAAEGVLQGNIDAANTSISNLDTRISNEYTRATTAESNLSTSLQAEVTRATNAEADLRSTLTRAYKAAGSILFAALPAPSASYLGFVYDITDAFTTTSDFVEGAGKDYPAGTNVAIVDVGTTSSPSYKYDAMPGFIDTSTFVEKTDYASTSAFGVVKVDGTTITSNNGVISSTGGGGSADTYKTTDTAETTIADNDYFPFYDSSASASRNSLWSNIIAKIKAALATVATTGAYSDLTGTPTLGTASAKNVPASGNASSSEVVMGNDSRLSDTRTPKSHATTSTTYGGATASNYGHAKLTDSYTTTSGVAAANSIAASGKAVNDLYNKTRLHIKNLGNLTATIAAGGYYVFKFPHGLTGANCAHRISVWDWYLSGSVFAHIITQSIDDTYVNLVVGNTSQSNISIICGCGIRYVADDVIIDT